MALEKDFPTTKMAKTVQEMVGKKYGRLTTIRFDRKDKNGNCYLFCLCDCGTYHTARTYCLKIGRTKSCGCWGRERAITHGDTDSVEFLTWEGIRGRCQCKTHNQYHNYGGRGIDLSDDWLKYENFLRDMGRKPSPEHSIDRINNNKGYSKENCRWATQKEQCRNKRNNTMIEFEGRKQCLIEWAEETGISSQTLGKRIFYLG